jgi:Domain of unknown function (DUF397)
MASSADLARAAWRTSSYSNNGGNCVEIAAAAGVVGVRDTKDRVGATLTFGPRAWQRFTARLKD